MAIIPKDYVEGEAFLGHKHTEQILSFGMQSKKINKSSANFSYDLAGAGGKIVAGDSKRGVIFEGNAVAGHIEGGYSVDYTSHIPKVQVKAGADTAKLSAAARVAKNDMEHKIASLDIKGPGIGASANFGKDSFLPMANIEAHTFSPSASGGIDDLAVDFGIGTGPNAVAPLSA